MKEWLRQNGKIDIWKTEAARIRDILRNRKHRVQASILAGMLALALLGGSVPGSHTPGVMAWWGSLYRREQNIQKIFTGNRHRSLPGGDLYIRNSALRKNLRIQKKK
mgnify:CR=1 FL=1